MDEIVTSSKALLHFSFNNVTVSNLEVKNIACIGYDTSFIIFEAGMSEYQKNLTLNNINIKDSKSNGPFIKLVGNKINFSLYNSKFYKILSYGSIIQNVSLKTNNSIFNTIFEANINSNKHNCGCIQFNYDINLHIFNSTFMKNKIKSDGGAICIKDIYDMGLNITSSVFDGNNAFNGGALFLKDAKDISMVNEENLRSITFNDNLFKNNEAENFGGAIYSEYSRMYTAISNNDQIIYNKAKYMGGGIYSPQNVNKCAFTNIENININNNTVNSYYNNYTSKPSYVLLTTVLSNNPVDLKSGDYFPLSFTLYDEFGKIIDDTTMYYSSLNLKITLKPNNEIQYEKPNIYLKGNVGSFVNGKCNLKNFQIYATPNNYTLEITIDGDDNINIDTRMNSIKVTINKCNDEQITIYDKKKSIFHCEKPICINDCSNNELKNNNVICKKASNDIYVNDKYQNYCECLSGWTGDNCQEKIYTDFKDINKRIKAMVYAILIILALYIMFITFYRNEGIISDFGIFKLLIFVFGLMTYFISNLFSTYMNYTGCSMHFFLRHVGISLIITIFYIIIDMNLELGIKPNNNNNSMNFEFSSDNENITSETSYENNYENKNVPNFNINVSKPINASSMKKIIQSSIKIEKSKYAEIISNNISDSNFRISKDDDIQLNEFIVKKIKKVRSLLVEAIFYNILVIICIFMIIILTYKKNITSKEENFKQNEDGSFYYKCKLNNSDLILNIIEFFIFFYILLKSNELNKYNNIFKCISYINYSIRIGILIGPIINIISYIIFDNQYSAKVIFNTLINTTCYFSIFIVFSFKNIYHILNKNGNKPVKYFIYIRHSECDIHHSTTCGCKLNITTEELNVNIRRLIDLYKVSSLIFEFIEGKIVYVNMKSKIEFIKYSSSNNLY